MTLTPGSRLGPFVILARLGAGGMGEVYRARDTRLDRELAIKVLPQSLAGDESFLARFRSEARAASALNHPNIVTIHDMGSADGLSYILMELVEGKTVRELLDAGPPPLKKALLIAAQTADGLAAAHERGIVHRDLKPENLIVSKDGIVKILDFGLAKTTPLYADAVEETRSYDAAPTRPGSVLGTVGYMSPEQAAGRSSDPRSDQFSLGTIVHEMLTGKKPWKRDSAAETLAAIIREDPQPPLPPATPTALRWIVERCLAKDPEERYASTRDLARDLGTVRAHVGELSSAISDRAGRPARRRSTGILLAGLLAVAALGLGVLVASRLRRAEKPILPQWTQFGFRRGTVWHGRFAPDGQTVVYSAAFDGDPSRLFSTRPGSTETRTLDLPPGRLLSISSKSELAFLRDLRLGINTSQPGTLVRAGLEGGVGRDVLEDVLTADWTPDGSELAVVREIAGKNRLEYPIGKTLYETAFGQSIWNLRFSPDGAWLAFYETTNSGAVVAVRVADGLRRVLSDGWFMSAIPLAWSPDGREVWFTPQKQVKDTSPALMAATLTGQVREVTRGPGQLRLFDIARDGRLLVARWDLQIGLRGASSASGRERELSATDDSNLADLTGDGRTALIYDRNALFLRPMDGSPPLRLGEGLTYVRLSPDGKLVLADSKEGRVLVPVGAGDVRRIEAVDECEEAEWLPDGKQIVCEVLSHPGIRLSFIEVASGKRTAVSVSQAAASDFESGGPISADGALLSGIGRSGDLWVLPLAGGEARRIPVEKGSLPVGWTADGRHLFVHRGGTVPARVQKLDLGTGRVAPWKDLSLEDPAGIVRIYPVKVRDDGRSWAFSYIRILSNLYVVDGLK